MPDDRPYLQYSTSQLEELFESDPDDVSVLTLIAEELAHRNRRLAQELLLRVEEALWQLDNSAPTVTPVADSDEMEPDVTSQQFDEEVETSFPGTDWAPDGAVRTDEHQLAVTEAQPGARVLVDAGPGTGKTAVACARVASLIGMGVEPSNVWLLSFTRTAVHEIRNRIRDLVREEAAAASVRITTLDSHAWQLVNGFDEDAKGAFGSYEQSITDALTLLEGESEEVAEYLESLEHLIVDEAQDLVGIRARLVGALIRRVPASCGVTVLSDQAQAIYGFSETDEGRAAGDVRSFSEQVLAGEHGAFEHRALKTIHRTNSPSLTGIFRDTRTLVLSQQLDRLERVRRVEADIRERADGTVGKVQHQNLAGRDDVLVLFRQRAAALMCSSILWNDGIPNRLRTSGTPAVLPAWVALLLGDHEGKHLSREQFLERWEDRIRSTDGYGDDPEVHWRLLHRLGSVDGRRVDLGVLRKRLSRSQPPIEFGGQELGPSGPILGTIHASKGREADIVHLMMPELPTEDFSGDLEEEARILFVGATRARRQLLIGEGPRIRTRSLNKKRCWRRYRDDIQLEVGRPDDVDVSRQVSTSLFSSTEQAHETQTILRELISTPSKAVATLDIEDNRSHKIWLDNKQSGLIIGALSQKFRRDLEAISEQISKERWLPSLIPHLRVIGVRSVVLAEGDPTLGSLHPPFDETGCFLAPIVVGFSMAYY